MTGVFRSEANARRRAEEVGRFVAVEVHPVAGAAGPRFTVKTAPMSEVMAQLLKDELAAAGIQDTRLVVE